MTHFRNYRDRYGSETFIRPFAEDCYVLNLREGATVALPVPAGMSVCIINGGNYFVSTDPAFEIPTAPGLHDVNAEFEGAGYMLSGVTNLYFKSEINTVVSVAFYE